MGDVICVNGKAWPFLTVQPKRYRFLFLNGSNARTYEMDFKVAGKGKSPVFWQIGTDGGYLDQPVPVQKLILMPGERADVIIDFAGFCGRNDDGPPELGQVPLPRRRASPGIDDGERDAIPDRRRDRRGRRDV